jgi:hypothetical protein
MIIRSVPRAPRAPALLALFLLLCVAPASRAAEGDGEPTAEGWRKVFAYARCAFEVWKAVTPTDWGTAFFDCGRTFLDESNPGEKP